MATKAATSPEYDRFDALVTQVLSVPKVEIKKLIAEDKRKADANPNKRGPKRKLKQPA
jgi:hypothetical protein